MFIQAKILVFCLLCFFQYPFSAITVNNYLYVLGTRRSSSEEYKSCYRFSTRTCEWTKLQNLLHDRSRFAAVHIDKYIYMYVKRN